jgi:Fe-S cluster biogenesis protein NfuA
LSKNTSLLLSEPELVQLRHTVELVLNSQVRPVVKVHGGGVLLCDVTDEGVVELAFEGACNGCSLKSVTYALGVRQKLLPIPGVTVVNMKGVRLSDAALARVGKFYGKHSPWVGAQRMEQQ